MERQNYLSGLDPIRFVAAASVMLFHLGFWIWKPEQILPFLWVGWVGVEVFFVISGVVISMSAERLSPVSFAVARALRLYPCAIICSTITLIVVLMQGGGMAAVPPYLRSLALIPHGPWIDPAYWTLAIEVMFYIAIFVVIAIWGPRRIEVFAYVVGAVSTVYNAIVLVQTPAGMEPIYVPGAGVLLLRPGSQFAVGILIWALVRRGVTPLRIGAMLVLISGGVMEIMPTASWRATAAAIPEQAWLASAMFLAGTAAITASCVRPGGGLPKWVRLAGQATYPLYLLNYVTGAAAMKVLASLGASRLASLCIVGCGMVIISLAVAAWAEPWLRGRMRMLIPDSWVTKPA